jgi:crotonobetainyl-CoA:carnitine CoA-transferase CaiB-like acyl-CoA transferase
VVEVAQNLAGPYCGRILQELGADVVKVEPPGGDAARSWGPPFHQGAGTIFAFANAGKRSVTLDLKTEAGREALRDLLRTADVLIHALRPGVMEGLGFTDEELHAANPRLIRFQVSAYGDDGPLAGLPGYEPLMQAQGGVMANTGPRGGDPVRVGTSVVDMGTGMWGAIGVLSALRERDRTGVGGRVSGALFETAVAWSGYHLLGAADDGTVPVPMGTELAMICPYGAVPTSDGEVLLAVGTDGLFKRLCGVLDLDGMADDPRFATNPDRVAHRAEVNRRVHDATRRYDTGALLERLRGAGVPCAPIQDVGELLRDPQLQASGMLRSSLLPSGREGLGVGLPFRLGGRRPPTPTSVPGPGEHTGEVLREIGRDETGSGAPRDGDGG